MEPGPRIFNQISSDPISIALPGRLWQYGLLKLMNHKSRIPANPLVTGQVWRMEGSRLLIELVGKHLVHYKLIKDEAKRTPLSLSNKKSVEKYLKDKKAVLVQG